MIQLQFMCRPVFYAACVQLAPEDYSGASAIKHAVAQAVHDKTAFVVLDFLSNMRVVAKYKRGAGIDGDAGQRLL